ncbi:MAG: Phosphocarrier protein HPr [Planctomycetes bacterium ADurb.Bin401]|nr:MAG: Phosphocarrier protein HPr [Planctomycetes bacterium ADurb.Bin401]
MAGSISQIEVEIKNANGMHMRPAMQFVDVASRFQSKISVSNNQITVDGKSIMHMAMLAAGVGTKLKITADGPDAHDALKALRDLVEVRMFDEPGWQQKV